MLSINPFLAAAKQRFGTQAAQLFDFSLGRSGGKGF
jgi:hypothetical protein